MIFYQLCITVSIPPSTFHCIFLSLYHCINPPLLVPRRWHLWKRNYDLYLGKRQFASIEGGLLAWEFVLRDAAGGVLALVDRNFQGFGKELFTDAGKYVVHFGEKPQQVCTTTYETNRWEGG